MNHVHAGAPFSPALVDFLTQEVQRFEIFRSDGMAFDAKQRMIERAQAVALREAYRMPTQELWFPPLADYVAEIVRAEQRLVAARAAENSAPSDGARVPHTQQRHREELALALFTFAYQQIELRRTQTLSLFAGFAALIVSVIAIVISVAMGAQ